MIVSRSEMGSTDLAQFFNTFAGNISDDLCFTHLQTAAETTMYTPSPSNSSSFSTPSPMPSPMDKCDDGEPYLEIVEQPVPSFRFRYRSEMQGAHGSLLGKGDENSRRKCYPTVQLHNFSGDAIIRCSLYSADINPIPHIHQLIARKNNKDVFDHELTVSERNNFKAEFRGLGIVHVSKKHLKDEIVRKAEKKLFEMLRNEGKTDETVRTEIAAQRPKIEAEAEKDAKMVDPNRAKLCFEAFVKDQRGRVYPLCSPVFSESILNMKSAETCELKICRMDRYMGTCRGGDEVYILVEKVCKKNIKVRFFEEDEFGTEVWEDFATFHDYDVHHQYAIVFRTPPYRKDDIEEKVQVKVQLFRPNNKQYSEPLDFVYKPARPYLKKRRCNSVSTNSSLNSLEAKKYCQPAVLEQLGVMLTDENPLLSGTGSELSSLGSLKNLSSDALKEAVNIFVHTEQSEPQLLSMFSEMDFDAFLCNDHELPCTDPEITFDGAASKKKSLNQTAVRKIKKNVDQRTISMVEDACNQLHDLLKSEDSNRNQEIKKLLKTKEHEMGPLHAAVVHGQLKELGILLSLLIKGGLCKFINTTNHLKETPLILAAKKRKDDCVKVLLSAGADVNLLDIDQNSALHWAVRNSHSGIVKELVSYEKYDGISKKVELDKPNKEGETPLHTALLLDDTSENRCDIVELLLGANANPNIVFDNYTPLMLAIQQDDCRSVKALIKAGADRNISGGVEYSPLHLAVELKHHKCLKELLSFEVNSKNKKIDLNKKNEQGETPLHMAVQGRDVTSVELLIQAGCDVNAKIPTSGNTALHLAVQHFSRDVIKFLMHTESLNVYDENFCGQTALDLSETESNQQELASLLKKLSFMEVKEEVMSGDEHDYADSLLIDEDVEESKEQNTVISRGNRQCNGSSSSEVEENPLFDNATLEVITHCLDIDNRWKQVCQKLNCGFLETSFTQVQNPTSSLITYIELERKVTLDAFLSAVKDVGAEDAVNAIEKMISKKLNGTQRK